MSDWPGGFMKYWSAIYHDDRAFKRDYLKMLCLQVMAINMALVVDGSWQQLFDVCIFEAAFHGLKDGKCADGWGLVG